MKRIITIVLIFALAGPALGQERRKRGALSDLDIVKPNAHVPPARSPEQVAARFAERFAETLDFSIPYKESVVRNAERRARILSSNYTARWIVGDSRGGVSPSLAEELYIAAHNWQLLQDLYLLSTQSLDFLRRRKEATYPKEFEAERRTIMEAFAKRSGRSSGRLSASDRIVLWVEYYTDLAELYRRHMPARPLDTPNYKVNLSELYRALQITSDQAGMAKVDARFGQFTDGRVYDLVRGHISFKIKQEEDGNFRVYYANPILILYWTSIVPRTP